MRFLILVLAFFFIGCGRVNTISEPINDGSDGGENTTINIGQKFMVNQNILNDQKNPNLTRISDELLIVVYVDEKTFTIKAVLYDNSLNRLIEKTLYTEHAILDSRPGICKYKNGFALCWESLDGVYLACYDIYLNRTITEQKILAVGNDDAMITSIDDIIFVVYETNQSSNKDIYGIPLTFN